MQNCFFRASCCDDIKFFLDCRMKLEDVNAVGKRKRDVNSRLYGKKPMKYLAPKLKVSD